MALHSMMRTDMEMEEQKESICTPKEKYPYGLRIHLDRNSLKKLGIDVLPMVGSKMMLTAMVEVSNIEMSENEEGVDKSMSLQITAMQFDKAEGRNAEERLYGIPRDETKENPNNVMAEGL